MNRIKLVGFWILFFVAVIGWSSFARGEYRNTGDATNRKDTGDATNRKDAAEAIANAFKKIN